MRRFLLVLSTVFLLTMGSAILGCSDMLKPPVVAVNTAQTTLTDINATLTEIETHELKAAIDAAKTPEEAIAEKQRIMLRFHPIWKLYDRARASWTISQIGTAAGIEAEKAGGQVNFTSITAAALSLAKDFDALSAAMKALVQ